MKRTTIFLREDVEGDLRAIARRQRIAVAEVVREALDAYVARSKKRAVVQPGFIAVGASGDRDGAERHEELLWKGLEPHYDALPTDAKPIRPRRAAPVRRKRTG